MSLVAISGNASGTGTLTIAAPNTNSNFTLTLPTATTELVGTDATQTLTNKTLTTPNIDSAQVATVSGTASLYMARAWVNFNGTGTVAIRASGNVTSITDNGAGDYTVNFTTAMPDTNYSFFGSSGQTAAATIPAMLGINRDNLVYSTTAIRLYNLTGAGALPDSAYLNVCIFR
jgi:hypothetical protein